MGPPAAGLPEIQNIFKQIVSISVTLAFIALVIVLVYGGVRYLTSGGDPKAIKPAGETITWALLGILFMVIAWLILLLIKSFTGLDIITQFKIGALCTDPDITVCIKP